MKSKRNFIAKGKNTAFKCLNCSVENLALKGGLRNHCKNCLFSLHLDFEIPGDRLSSCKALMKVAGLDYNGKKGYILIHECLKCGKIMRNKMAKDDDFFELKIYNN